MADDGRRALQFSPPLPEHVVFVALDPDDDPATRLYPSEGATLGPRTVPKRRREFERGRAAARMALNELGHGEPAILVGPHREPLWPDGVVGSITHAGGYALAAVANREGCGGVGLDPEERRVFPELRAEVAHGGEVAWMQRLAESERERTAFELFSAKEAIYKAFFPRVGHFFGFEAVELAPARGGFTARLVELLDAQYPPTRTFDICVGWYEQLVLSSVVLESDA